MNDIRANSARRREDEIRRLRARQQAFLDQMRREVGLPVAVPAVPLLTPEGTVWQITTLVENGDPR